jgi:hypothetical protein
MGVRTGGPKFITPDLPSATPKVRANAFCLQERLGPSIRPTPTDQKYH